MASILIIEDESGICRLLTQILRKAGHESSYCLTLADGLREVFAKPYEIVLLDVQLPDGNGLDAIGKIKGASSTPEVIILTGSGSPDGAESAIRWGAWDYIEKPASPKKILLPVIRALEYRSAKISKSQLVTLDRHEIIGDAPAIRTCIYYLAQASRSDVNVLITGETGTGKELFARALHTNSPRRTKPFVVVDCAALPESIVESLLFGHEKGAFTGADKSTDGMIKQAHGGTLFLDEVGELPQSLQKAFLRVLQEHRFRPVGSKHEETSEFRLIAATNRDLDQMAAAETFRKDLLFRIRSFPIELPPLRERRQDIRQLTTHYLAKACGKARIPTKGFSPDFFETLETHDWPGNVRELFGVLQSALASGYDDPILYPLHLPVEIRAKAARFFLSNRAVHGKKSAPPGERPCSNEPLPLFEQYRKMLLENGEKKYFSEIVSRAGGNVLEACSISGLSRSRLYHFLRKHDLSVCKETTPAESADEQ
ncbi:MAG: sigma-54 dependent transcriptional regulator [Desulfobacteraceae bacterium]|nr:sigma-54 dependent transcriptional regulator [Desulfobacteraceae bacterium]